MTKGIFCIEGAWVNDLRDVSTVKPILELLQKGEGVPYIHHDSLCKEELFFLLAKWAQKRYKDYPILYLAMHGTTHGLVPYMWNTVPLNEIAEKLKGKCTNRIILMGSCLIFKSSIKILSSFKNETDALAICGYQTSVGWTESTAFELLLMSTLQKYKFNKYSLRFIEEKLTTLADRFPDLKFRIIT